MAGNTPTVKHFQPLIRQGASAYVEPAAQWVDNLVLVGGTAGSYTPPTGTDPAGNAGAGRTVNAMIFKISVSAGPVYANFNGYTAAVPVASTTNGEGHVIIEPGAPYWVTLPLNGQELSFFCAGNSVVAISSFW